MRFTKEYERDCSLVIEELWGRGLHEASATRLGAKPPFSAFVLFFVTDENMQIWEHGEALHWFLDRILEKNRQGTEFIDSIIGEYLPLLEEIKGYWKRGATDDVSTLESYLATITRAVPLFSIWYYSGSDERTPENVKEKVLELRKVDEFFSENDVYIKACIEKRGGDPKYGNLVLSDEFITLPSIETLQERAKGTISIDGKERFFMPLEAFAEAHTEYELAGLKDTQATVQEVKGQVAQKGLMRGTVRILKNKFQLDQVQEGDVIVSPMTTPDFLPAMRRAAAFVTDEGGIMCHAAIVARELKKPCVIGTKFATQVFKDGDLVEVHADDGIVRLVQG